MDTILLQGKDSKLHRYKYIIQKKVATILPFSRDNNNAFLVALVMSCQTDKCTLFWIGPFHLLLKTLFRNKRFMLDEMTYQNT